MQTLLKLGIMIELYLLIVHKDTAVTKDSGRHLKNPSSIQSPCICVTLYNFKSPLHFIHLNLKSLFSQQLRLSSVWDCAQ